jgi:hypothetical protein
LVKVDKSIKIGRVVKEEKLIGVVFSAGFMFTNVGIRL